MHFSKYSFECVLVSRHVSVPVVLCALYVHECVEKFENNINRTALLNQHHCTKCKYSILF